MPCCFCRTRTVLVLVEKHPHSSVHGFLPSFADPFFPPPLPSNSRQEGTAAMVRLFFLPVHIRDLTDSLPTLQVQGFRQGLPVGSTQPRGICSHLQAVLPVR